MQGKNGSSRLTGKPELLRRIDVAPPYGVNFVSIEHAVTILLEEPVERVATVSYCR